MQILPGDAAIRDTIAAAFSSEEFSRSITDIFWEFVRNFFDYAWYLLRSWARDSPLVFWTGTTLLVLSIALLLMRGWYIARYQSRLSARARGRDGDSSGAADTSDPWHLVQHLAERGDYTEAAHALYRHLLDWLVPLEKLSLHPSKTIGDYARDLRARSSRYFSGYRDFARTYEFVVYGIGSCDRDRFERLLALARALKEQR